jgi:hypothetical protein
VVEAKDHVLVACESRCPSFLQHLALTGGI